MKDQLKVIREDVLYTSNEVYQVLQVVERFNQRLFDIQPWARPASPPPVGERSKFLNSLRASDLAWLPPTAHGNCSEAARTFAISLLSQYRDLC